MNRWLIVTGAVAVLMAAGWWIVQSGPVSAGLRDRYGPQCADWIGKEFGDGRARVGSAWRKRGKLVFEVLVPKKGSASASVFLCVVDTSAGTMIKPSAFDGSWR